MYRGLRAIMLVMCLALAAAPAIAERLLASRADMTAILSDDYKCGKTIPLTVRSGSEDAFTGDRVELQRMLGGLRVVFGFECPEAENMIIDGEVAGKKVFKGAAAKDQDWLLIVLIEPQQNAISEAKPSPTESATIEPVTPAAPASVATGTTANSTPKVAAVLPEPKQDYCGPAGEKFKSFMVADELFGPFGDACQKHDECYTTAASKIIQSMETKYKMSVVSLDSLTEYREEAKSLFESEKQICDDVFKGTLKTACLSDPDKALQKKLRPDEVVVRCNNISAVYYAGVRSVWGQNAFDGAVEHALQTPRKTASIDAKNEEEDKAEADLKKQEEPKIEAKKGDPLVFHNSKLTLEQHLIDNRTCGMSENFTVDDVKAYKTCMYDKGYKLVALDSPEVQIGVTKTVQKQLNSLGYNAGPADGVLGEQTIKAIEQFQKNNGNPDSGIVSGKLISDLAKAGQAKKNTPSIGGVEDQQIIEAKLNLVLANVNIPSDGPSKNVLAEYFEEFFGEITARAGDYINSERFQKHPYLAGCIKGDGEYYICKTCAPFTWGLAQRGEYAGAVSGAYFYSSKFSRSVETASGWRATPITSRIDDLRRNDNTYFETSFAYARDKRHCGTVNYISDKCIVNKSKSQELFNLYAKRHRPEFFGDIEVKKLIGKSKQWCAKRIKEFY
ncbi:MAG: peptidoglycan-binding domain-containing protein [Sneathiella sp.]